MKRFVLPILLLFSFVSFCQLPVDSLSKYSYVIIGFDLKGATDHFGTCFFIKKNSRLFLVTAKHVLYSCDPASDKFYSPFDHASVSLPKPFNSMQILLPPRNDSCLSMHNDADLLVLEIDPSWSNKVNSVERFMVPPFNRVGDAEIFGQGFHSDSVRLSFESQHNIHLPANSFKIEESVRYENPDFIDSFDYTFITKEIIKSKSLNGFSGSPVFLQEKNSKRWRIAGVLVGVAYASQGNKKRLFVVKQDIMSKQINELNSPRPY
jgi:hypothetical protein